ncbi:TonB-dependent receptor domain-containing protein [Sphingomonas qomolangmaensis]|uniref:TonB-dependent receptor n=1 Tax=Sphingomonas qomolangmaensis TaxID=2918765 RepID=A0ABY5L8B6_9SPHN|nr:TonB-dependent receptor [Sphingomonas qomolangmaensis]UUL83218.1 TonB-dependent receptor [Sphingomonas qomolangmaensis]
MMKQQTAFGSLLLLTTQLVAPQALAAAVPNTRQTSTPPAGQTVAPGAGGTQAMPQTVAPDSTSQQAETEADILEEAEISGPGSGDAQEDIVVIGRNIPNIVRATPQVVSVLTTADIARTGEGDIAGALTRVTGLSVVGNGFVFVRGLGDRYSSSLLNGLPLPSPEPLRRVVPLDIFPTNVVASALVQKSYSANYPGEFGGGAINLTTRAIPDESFLQVGGSVGFDTVTSSELGYVYDGGSADVFGFDDGERTVPGFIKDAGKNNTSVNDPNMIGQLSNAPTTLLEENYHIPANWSGEASFGTSFDVGGAKIGLIGAGGISNSWRTRAAIQQVATGADGGLVSDFDRVTTDNRIIVNGLFGLGAEIGDHRLRVTNVYVHDTLKQGILGQGDEENFGIPGQFGVPSFIVQNTNWFARQLFTSQAVAELDFGAFDIDLRGAYANTKREAPYEREFRYVYDPTVRDYTNALNTPSSATIAFSDLNEDLWTGAADFTYDFDADRPLSVSTGYAYSNAERSSSRYFFRFIGPNNGPVNATVAQLRPDYLLSDYIIGTNGITLRNESVGQGAAAYDASLEVHAGYVQAEAEVLDGLRASVGVRYETADQQVLSQGAIDPTNLSNNYWLPASTITWNFAEDMQLRVHASKTLARPQFRELAPQIYQDFESNRQFLGNPLLVDSELYNLEARYEWFFKRDQRFTLAGFYKRIDNPIEAIAFVAGGSTSLQTGFSNAPQATLYGGEVEFQKYVPLDFVGEGWSTARLLLLGNYTYTQSQLQSGNQLVPSPILGAAPQQSSLVFDDGAPLVGQSDHLVNAQIGIEDEESRTQFTVLFNYASERVTNRGPVVEGTRLPDIVEEPGLRLDVVFRQGIAIGENQSIDLKFEGRNLTKTRYQEYQIFPNDVRVDTNTYDLGRIFSVGISATL